jgi:1-acyl-sn-glycerol-3-phosphate acyltransferase
MKISDIVYKSYQEVQEMPRFNLSAPPIKAKWYLQLVAWLLSFPETFMIRSKIERVRMKGLKGPYILLCNHNSFVDFKVATRAVFPRRATYIVAIDGFINREWLLRNVGGIGKRKFVTDPFMFRQVRDTLQKQGVISEIYPEARYSLVGTSSMLPESLGKMIKLLKYPVVTLISHGHHLRQPFWNLQKRKVRTKSVLHQVLTKDEVLEKSMDEINEIIQKSFKYDDYQYQKENNIKITFQKRAEGLHKPLYQCPDCLTEFQMKSKGTQIWCEACGIIHEMDELGQLHNTTKETIFTHIPDWFEWQREQVKDEIFSGKYNVEIPVHIESLPNSTGFYRLEDGVLRHNKNGLFLNNPDFSLHKTPISMFGIHIEYDYFTKGDCVSFSTLEDTYYLYPIDQTYNVTKFHFAVEEYYKLAVVKKNENKV